VIRLYNFLHSLSFRGYRIHLERSSRGRSILLKVGGLGLANSWFSTISFLVLRQSTTDIRIVTTFITKGVFIRRGTIRFDDSQLVSNKLIGLYQWWCASRVYSVRTRKSEGLDLDRPRSFRFHNRNYTITITTLFLTDSA